MKRAAILFALLALGLVAQVAVSAQTPKPVDLTGTWIGKTDVPNQGPDEVTIVFRKIDNVYAGTIVDSLGMIARDTEMKDVELKGDELTLNFPLVDGTTILCRLKVAGDKITGQWGHPEGDVGDFEFTRKK